MSIFSSFPTEAPLTNMLFLEHGASSNFYSAAGFIPDSSTNQYLGSSNIQYHTLGSPNIKAISFNETDGPHNDGLQYDYGGRMGSRYMWRYNVLQSRSLVVFFDSTNRDAALMNNLKEDFGNLMSTINDGLYSQVHTSHIVVIASHQNGENPMTLREIADFLELSNEIYSKSNIALFGCSDAGFTLTSDSSESAVWSSAFSAAFRWLGEGLTESYKASPPGEDFTPRYAGLYGRRARNTKTTKTTTTTTTTTTTATTTGKGIWERLTQFLSKKKVESTPTEPSAVAAAKEIPFSPSDSTQCLVIRGKPVDGVSSTSTTSTATTTTISSVAATVVDVATPVAAPSTDLNELADLEAFFGDNVEDTTTNTTFNNTVVDDDQLTLLDASIASSDVSEVSSLNESMIDSDSEYESDEVETTPSPVQLATEVGAF